MKKRFWALFLAVMMVVSVLPTSAFAGDAEPPVEGKVTATKTLVENGDGTYTINLSVQGNPVKTNTRPNADVVLVVDNSGSMASSVGTPCESTTFEKIDTIALSLLGTGFYWDIYECPTCHARYIRSYSQFVGVEVQVFFDTRPEKCTGETGEVVRMDAAIAVSKEFASNILAVEGNRIAVIGFAHQENEGGANDTGAIKVAQDLTKDLDVVKSKIDSMEAEGGTNYTAALQKAYDYLDDRSDEDKESRPGYVIFISDGAPGRSGESQGNSNWDGSTQITNLKAANITVYTVGIALDDSAAKYLKSMASDEQDKHFINVTGEDYQKQLSDYLAQWAEQIKEVPAGTNAVMTDVVDIEKFEIVDGGYKGLTLGEDNKTLTWKIGDIPETVQEKTIKIKPRTGVYGENIPTNENVCLTYLPAGANEEVTIPKVDIGDPKVTIKEPPATTVTVTYTDGVESLEVFEDQVTNVNINTAPTAFNGDTATLTYTDTNGDKYIFVGWDPLVAQTVSQDTVYTAQWEKDNWHDATPNNPDDEDSDQGGDGIPDKYQVLVKYESEDTGKGTVAPAYEVITLTDSDGFVEEANVIASGSTATPESGYSFAEWKYNDKSISQEEVLPPQTIEDAVGGKIYTYTAYWTENVPDLSVEKTVASVGGVEVNYTAPSANIPTAKVGDTIVWNITVTNSGKADGSATLVDSIEGVKIYSVTDGIKTELTGNALTITVPANASVSYVAEYTVTTADKGQTLTNTITLSDGDNTTEDPSGTAGGVKVENIDVEKVFTGIYAPNSTTAKTGTTAEVGDNIKWTITVTNNGDEAVTIGTPTDVLTVDGIAVDSSLVTISTSAVDSDGKYTIPGKVEGQDASSIVFTVEYTVRAEDLNKQISNSATVNGVSDTADDTVNVGATPGLSVTKTVNKTSVTVGDTVKYTIKVTNTGNVDLTNVNVAEAFGGDLSKIFDLTGATKASPFNGFVIGELKDGATAEITFSYKTTTRGTLTNSVKVTGTYEPGKTVEDEAASSDVTVKSEPIPPVGPSKPQLNYENHYAYVVGYPDGLVHPERNITRAEVATIFFRMLLDESREYFWAQENDFSDVAETDWFNNAVSTLANAHLINGYPDGSYRPNANITRAEFATIAIRFFLDEDVEIEENNLSDVKGHWAEANINLAYALELINGYPDGTFRPDQKITRAEAMAIVNRVLKRAPEKDHLLKDMIEWPDNLNTAAWYYADVQEATNSHKFHMDKEEEYEIWTELLPVRDWVALEQEWSKANSSKNPGEVVDIKITTPEAGDNGLKLD